MKDIEILVVSGLLLGSIIGLYMILRDPIHFFKSTIRGLYENGLPQRVLFFPIWFPVFVVDKLFNLKIFISKMKDDSESKVITPSDYEQFILVNINSEDTLVNILKEALVKIKKSNSKFTIKHDDISFCNYSGKFLVKIDSNNDLGKLNKLIHYFSNADNSGRTINTKGILLNWQDFHESFFYFLDTDYPLKLIGKNYRNRKLYLDINPVTGRLDTIYFNSNIDYFKNLNFDKLQKTIKTLLFKEMPSA